MNQPFLWLTLSLSSAEPIGSQDALTSLGGLLGLVFGQRLSDARSCWCWWLSYCRDMPRSYLINNYSAWVVSAHERQRRRRRQERRGCGTFLSSHLLQKI